MTHTVRSVLFVGSNIEDYLADGLLHGLKSLFGGAVVDVPKPDYLYRSFPAEFRSRLYGRGFSLYCRLPEYPTYRARFEERLERGEFDLVVFASVHRTPQELLRLRRLIPSTTRVALLDGEDSPVLFPRAPQLARYPELTALRFDPRWLYFKREWDDEGAQRVRDRLLRHLPCAPPRSQIRRISFSIPADLILEESRWDEVRPQEFPAHVVDPEAAAALGRTTKYAFADEKEYHEDLARSRFGITTKRSGWDCLRHYELAARGAIPCFRGLGDKPADTAPHGLGHHNSISYRDFRDLRAQIDSLDPARERALRLGALAWAREHTTDRQARRFVDALGGTIRGLDDRGSA